MERIVLPQFVVGTGRCGSTLVSNILRSHPAILSLSEFFTVAGRDQAFATQIVNGEWLWQTLSAPWPLATQLIRDGFAVPELLYKPKSPNDPRMRDGIPPILAVPLPHLTADPEEVFDDIRPFAMARGYAPVAEHYAALFEWLCRRFGKSLWVERSGGSLAYLDRIVEAWPEAHFVHIFRRGPDTALSMSRHPWFQLMASGLATGRAASHASLLASDERTLFAARQQPLERFGLYWSRLMIRGIAILDSLPADRVIHIQYERLLEEPSQAIRALVDFLTGTSAEPVWVESATALVQRKQRSSVDTLDPALRASLDRSCRAGERVANRLRG